MDNSDEVKTPEKPSESPITDMTRRVLLPAIWLFSVAPLALIVFFFFWAGSSFSGPILGLCVSTMVFGLAGLAIISLFAYKALELAVDERTSKRADR